MAVSRRLPSLEKIKKWAGEDNRLSVLVAGETGTGKSSLVNKIIGENVASAGLGSRSIQKDVTCYVKTIHDHTASIGCHRVLLYDTPGLNDTDLTAEEICRMMVEKTSGCVHVLIYCIDITSRFRRSDRELLTNLTKTFGTGIFDRTVFALTKADRVLSENPEKDLDALRGEFKKDVHGTLRDAGIPEERVKAIPFALTATKDDHFVPPECQQGGENEIRNWYWKEQLLLYMMARVDPSAVFVLVELHESTLSKFLQNHPYIAGVGSFALGAAFMATGGLAGVAAASTVVGSEVVAVLGGIGVGGEIGSMLHGVVSKKFCEWFKIKQE